MTKTKGPKNIRAEVLYWIQHNGGSKRRYFDEVEYLVMAQLYLTRNPRHATIGQQLGITAREVRMIEKECLKRVHQLYNQLQRVIEKLVKDGLPYQRETPKRQSRPDPIFSVIGD